MKLFPFVCLFILKKKLLKSTRWNNEIINCFFYYSTLHIFNSFFSQYDTYVFYILYTFELYNRRIISTNIACDFAKNKTGP